MSLLVYAVLDEKIITLTSPDSQLPKLAFIAPILA